MRLVVTPPSPPKKWWNISAAVAISSPMPSVIMAKAVARCFVAMQPNTMASAEAGEAGQQRHELHRQRQIAVAGGVEEVHHRIAAEAEERRVAQRKQAGLPKQHVVRQGEDDHHAHLAEHARS